MNIVMRKERRGMAAEWVRAGARQSDDMGGEELLSCRFFILENSSWMEVDLGDLPTQVRAGEEEGILSRLLDGLLDRLDGFLQGGVSEEEFCETVLWFGPEMAEEY